MNRPIPNGKPPKIGIAIGVAPKGPMKPGGDMGESEAGESEATMKCPACGADVKVELSTPEAEASEGDGADELAG